MGSKLTTKQTLIAQRIASNLRMSDQMVITIVTAFLAEQSKRPAPKRTGKK